MTRILAESLPGGASWSRVCRRATALTLTDVEGGANVSLLLYRASDPLERYCMLWHTGDDPPWRLRHFDELRFHPVSSEQLAQLRRDSSAGTWAPRIEAGHFSLAGHERFLAADADAIAAFRAGREAACAAERGAWEAAAV